MSDEKPLDFEEAPAEFDADYDERSADADVAAGRLVANERVMTWLQSIIDGRPEPPPFSHRSSSSSRRARVSP